jgi:hypothetical protein
MIGHPPHARRYVPPLLETEVLQNEGPQEFRIVSGRTFTVGANLPDLETLCAETFARPGSISSDVTPSAGQVSFDHFQITGADSADRPIEAHCFVIRIAVDIAPSRGGGAAQFCPFAFTDDSRVLAWLREVLGVPALLAEIAVDGLKLEVRTAALTADSDVVDDNALLIRLRWEKAADPLPNSPDQSGQFVQLKQMRDDVSPARACVQDFVTGTWTLTASAAPIPGGGSLMIRNYRSFALAEVLGIEEGELSIAGSTGFDGKLTIAALKSDKFDPAAGPRHLPPVHERPGDPQVPPPYRFRNVAISGYRLRAHHKDLVKICDKFLNHPFRKRRPFKYVPATSSVFIEHLHYGSMSSLAPPVGVVGPDDRETQKELVLRMLVARVDDDGLPGLGTDPRVFCPFICVDSGWSLVSGREVLGYPKLRGSFGPSSVSVFGHERPAVTVSRPFEETPPGLLIDPPSWLWGPPDLQNATLHPDTFLSAWLSGNTRGYGTIQLKQIRSAEDPALCRDQELIFGRYTLHGLEITMPSVSVEIELHPALAESIGLNGELHLIPAGGWYHVNCGFDLRMQDPLTI